MSSEFEEPCIYDVQRCFNVAVKREVLQGLEREKHEVILHRLLVRQCGLLNLNQTNESARQEFSVIQKNLNRVFFHGGPLETSRGSEDILDRKVITKGDFVDGVANVFCRLNFVLKHREKKRGC